MNDASTDLREKLRVLLMALPESDRAQGAVEMFEVARDLMTSDIRASNPGIPNYEVRAKIFERTCGTEFAAPDRDRIAKQIRSAPSARRADWG